MHLSWHFLSPIQTTCASRHEQAWETARAPAGRKQSPRSGAGLASKAGRPGASGAARPLAAASSGAVPQGASGAAQTPAAAANGAALRRSSANRAAAGDLANGRQLSDFLPAALQRSARLAPKPWSTLAQLRQPAQEFPAGGPCSVTPGPPHNPGYTPAQLRGRAPARSLASVSAHS